MVNLGNEGFVVFGFQNIGIIGSTFIFRKWFMTLEVLLLPWALDYHYLYLSYILNIVKDDIFI